MRLETINDEVCCILKDPSYVTLNKFRRFMVNANIESTKFNLPNKIPPKKTALGSNQDVVQGIWSWDAPQKFLKNRLLLRFLCSVRITPEPIIVI